MPSGQCRVGLSMARLALSVQCSTIGNSNPCLIGLKPGAVARPLSKSHDRKEPPCTRHRAQPLRHRCAQRSAHRAVSSLSLTALKRAATAMIAAACMVVLNADTVLRSGHVRHLLVRADVECSGTALLQALKTKTI